MNKQKVIESARVYGMSDSRINALLAIAEKHAQGNAVDLRSGLYLGNWFAEISDGDYHAMEWAFKHALRTEAEG